MQKVFISFILALLSIFTANAQTETYRLNVGQFDKLLICDDVNVVYRCVPDSSGFVSYQSTKEFADAFIFSNSKGKLKIQVITEDVDKPRLPTLYVYSDYLTWVENSSNYTVTIHNALSVPFFTARLVGNGKIVATNIKANEIEGVLATGNGSIILSGQAPKASYKMVGTGLIQADEMECDNVKCSILGSGTIGCWALKKLEVRGIGSTKIYYKGEPEIKKVGGGKLYPMTEYPED